MRQRVLILCTGNSARSQMAEGLLRRLGSEMFEVCSAGTKPTGVRPEAVAVMSEIGVDISGQRSKSLDKYLGAEFDYVITVCDHAKELINDGLAVRPRVENGHVVVVPNRLAGFGFNNGAIGFCLFQVTFDCAAA